ncbi:peptidoglycan-binding domain-containing protein [Streptomyces sp. NPDC002138]|uniref:peptidoglycan-binding domain-containing protein n=1 Tax=Streptomyces sp. NPDC002138 TaxID=3154410 RepID=UPI003331D2B4
MEAEADFGDVTIRLAGGLRTLGGHPSLRDGATPCLCRFDGRIDRRSDRLRPDVSAAGGDCTRSSKVWVGGYEAWVPMTAGGSVDCIMRQGSPYGSAVADLQSALKWCNGHNRLEINGGYGPLTVAAVRQSQEFYGIPVDGTYGPQTRRAMYWVANGTGDRTVCVKYSSPPWGRVRHE